MIKGIAYQKVDVTELEYKYYQRLIKEYSDKEQNGADFFQDLFDTDENGIITIIHPTKNVPWVILFFIQNLMINQHIRINDNRLNKIEKAIGV